MTALGFRTKIKQRPVQENSSWVPISKITRAKWTGAEVQIVECLFVSTKP
jgi:hypothetical protein